MSVANLGTIEIRCGQPYSLQVTLSQAGVGLDLSGWSARFAVAEKYDEAAIFSVTPLLSSAGLITAILDDAETLLLQPYERGCLVFQIDVQSPDDSDSHRLQGKVKIYPEILP